MQSYCSERCREADLARLLLSSEDAPPGSPAAELAELLAVPSESSLFLPLAVRMAAGVVAEAAASANGSRTLAGARDLVASLTTGGPWVEAGGVEPNPGHFPEEQDDESGDDDEDVDDDESDGGSAHSEVGSDDGGGSGGESESGEEEDEDLPLLLATTWRLLLDTFAARLPPTQRSRRLLRQFDNFGPGWLASLVSALERNALPVSAPPPQVDAPPLEGMIFAVAAASINHSCVPSCAVHFGRTASDEAWDGWEAPSLLLLRDVAEEEELTIAYVDAEAPLRERTAALAALHGFHCRCERCGVQRGVSRTARKLREEGASERSLDELGALGLRALDAGLFDDALKALRLLLDSDKSKGRHSETRRADATLRLGGALQRLHRFDEARAAWLEGADAFGFHVELQREAATARAYQIVPSVAGGEAAEAVEEARRGELRVCSSRVPLLEPHECAAMIESCEAHAAASGGWSTQRHTTVPTTDMPVHVVDSVLRAFNDACAARIFPFLEREYGASMGATATRLRVSDAFVVRYDAAAQRSLPTHQDDSHLSLTIALNDASEYEGGGTAFEDVDGASPSRPIVASPQLGHVVAFPGALRHGGAPVTRGVRHIVAAFLWVASEEAASAPPARRGTKRERGAAEAPGGDAGGAAKAAAFEAWLGERGASWNAAVRTTTDGVAAGWGCVARAPIRAGTELFRVPRAACFGASASGPVAADEDAFGVDTQEQTAMLLLAERAKGASSAWAPLLDCLQRSAACPWTWSAEARQWLDGTELQPVVEMKLNRLEAERAAMAAARRPAAAEYADACALASSMLNPFFGGSIVPFNCHLNWSEAPNVVFDAEGDDVVGRAERPIAAGDELTQGYADSTAELVYRYGFSPTVGDGMSPPMEEDVVSIRVHSIAAACGDAAVRRVRQYGPLLSAAGLADAQTWDGVGDDLTVELSAGATGTAQLVGTALTLLSPNAAAAPRARGKNSDDATAAALLAHLCGSDVSEARALARVAQKAGGDDRDPWPALLRRAAPSAALDAARAAATRAVNERLGALEHAPMAAAPPAGSDQLEWWRMARRLRELESALLREAAAALASGAYK